MEIKSSEKKELKKVKEETSKSEKKFYRAIKRGHDGRRIIEVGEVFEYSSEPGSWMIEVDPKSEIKRIEDEKFLKHPLQEKKDQDVI